MMARYYGLNIDNSKIDRNGFNRSIARCEAENCNKKAEMEINGDGVIFLCPKHAALARLLYEGEMSVHKLKRNSRF